MIFVFWWCVEWQRICRREVQCCRTAENWLACTREPWSWSWHASIIYKSHIHGLSMATIKKALTNLAKNARAMLMFGDLTDMAIFIGARIKSLDTSMLKLPLVSHISHINHAKWRRLTVCVV